MRVVGGGGTTQKPRHTCTCTQTHTHAHTHTHTLVLYMEFMFCPAGRSVLLHEYGIDGFVLALAGSTVTVSCHVEWMFLICRKHCVMSCGMDIFDMQEALCHVMGNGCF